MKSNMLHWCCQRNKKQNTKHVRCPVTKTNTMLHIAEILMCCCTSVGHHVFEQVFSDSY